MRHQMHLDSESFDEIRTGNKTIEIRLNDEKRQQIKVGDVIEFSSRQDPSQKVHTEVAQLYHFPNFETCFAAFSPEKYGGKRKGSGDYKAMYKYYSEEDEAKYGVLAIEVRTLV